MRLGIDVSENNGEVDFEAVKDAGYEFVIVRLGYGNQHLDSMFYDNINNAIEAGLGVGVYYYDYGLDTERANVEAEFTAQILQASGLTPSDLKMGVWFDMEDADGWKAAHGMPSDEELTNMCFNYVLTLNEYGYNCGVYASYDWLVNRIDTDKFAEYVPFWNAEWSENDDFARSTIWQFTDSAEINGKYFDANMAY